jgi:hypothetical protein
VYYWGFDPEKLGNPKIYAKVTIVGVLSANAIFLHATVLPIVHRQISRRLFAGLSTHDSVYMIIGGATSATSWYVPVALGAVPQLNFIVPAQTIWASYCAILLAANAVTIATFFALKHLVAGTNDPGTCEAARSLDADRHGKPLKFL